MNLEELRSVQTRERSTDSLQELRDSFYAEVAEYVADLKAERDAAAAETDDPFGDPEVGRLTDEIETAERVATAIYERRVGKVVKQASFAAAGSSREVEGLTDEERDLYEDLVERIETSKSRVLAAFAGEDPGGAGPGGGPETTDGPADPPGTTDGSDEASDHEEASGESPGDRPGAEAAATARPPEADEDPSRTAGGDGPAGDADGRSSDEAAESSEGSTGTAGGGDDPDRTTLRITRDVGEVFGVDEQVYDLAADDVVSLPEANAEPLLDRDAAERLDG